MYVKKNVYYNLKFTSCGRGRLIKFAIDQINVL